MAKSKPNSKHTRAARRAASPSLDIDKSLTSLPRVESAPLQRDSILVERANAGVSKKQSKPKSRSRAQKERQEKGMARAEAVIDQLENKVAKSVTRAKTVNARRADWEEMNRKNSKSMFQALQEQGDDDNDDDDVMADDSATRKSRKSAPKPTPVTQNQVVDEHTGIDEDEEIT